MSDLRRSGWVQWVIGLALSSTLLWFLPQIGNLLLVMIAGLIVLGALRPFLRLGCWRFALAALYGACLSLVLHLLADDFHLRYIWLYSSAALPSYLKMSNLWGGDEGTVLLLATLCMTIGIRNAALPGWSGRSNALVAAWSRANKAVRARFLAEFGSSEGA